MSTFSSPFWWLTNRSGTPEQIRLGQLIVQLPALARAIMKVDAELDYIAKYHQMAGTTAPVFAGKSLADTRALLNIVHALYTAAHGEVLQAARAATEAKKIVEGRDWRLESVRPPDIAGYQMLLAVAVVVLGMVLAIVAALNRPSQVASAISQALVHIKTSQAYTAAWFDWYRRGRQGTPPPPPVIIPSPVPPDEMPSGTAMATAATGIGVAGFAALALVALVMLKGRRR